jgi:hypothetical protein
MFKEKLTRITQGTFMPKISFLGIIVSEKIFKELLTPKFGLEMKVMVKY